MIGLEIGVCVVGLLSTQTCSPAAAPMVSLDECGRLRTAWARSFVDSAGERQRRLERLQRITNLRNLLATGVLNDAEARQLASETLSQPPSEEEHRYCIRVLQFSVKEGSIEARGLSDGVLGKRMWPSAPDAGGGR